MTLQLYLNQSGGNAATMPLASKIVDASGAVLGTNRTNWLGGAAGYRELYANGDAGNSPGLASPGPPSKHGWVYEGNYLNNALIPAGSWDDTIALIYLGGVAITVDVLHRWYQYKSSDDSFTWLGEQLYSSLSVQPGTHQYSQSGLVQPERRFPVGTYLYEDMWMKTSAVIPNSVAVGQGNTGNLGSTSGSFSTIPDPLPLQYTVDLINLLLYQHEPLHQYPDKDYILSIGEDGGVRIQGGGASVVFSQCVQPVSDVYVQMVADPDQYGRRRFPMLMVYRVNSTGTLDMLLTANDGNTYQVPFYKAKLPLEQGTAKTMVVARGDRDHIFDLHVWCSLSR
jgi:hypothetical protein